MTGPYIDGSNVHRAASFPPISSLFLPLLKPTIKLPAVVQDWALKALHNWPGALWDFPTLLWSIWCSPVPEAGYQTTWPINVICIPGILTCYTEKVMSEHQAIDQLIFTEEIQSILLINVAACNLTHSLQNSYVSRRSKLMFLFSFHEKFLQL